jgi:hypothetical protein
MKNEYDMIVLMHSTLLQLDDTLQPMIGKVNIYDDSLYSVEGFDGPKLQKANSIVTQSSFKNKLPRQKSAIVADK